MRNKLNEFLSNINLNAEKYINVSLKASKSFMKDYIIRDDKY